MGQHTGRETSTQNIYHAIQCIFHIYICTLTLIIIMYIRICRYTYRDEQEETLQMYLRSFVITRKHVHLYMYTNTYIQTEVLISNIKERKPNNVLEEFCNERITFSSLRTSGCSFANISFHRSSYLT